MQHLQRALPLPQRELLEDARPATASCVIVPRTTPARELPSLDDVIPFIVKPITPIASCPSRRFASAVTHGSAGSCSRGRLRCDQFCRYNAHQPTPSAILARKNHGQRPGIRMSRISIAGVAPRHSAAVFECAQCLHRRIGGDEHWKHGPMKTRSSSAHCRLTKGWQRGPSDRGIGRSASTIGFTCSVGALTNLSNAQYQTNDGRAENPDKHALDAGTDVPDERAIS